LLVVEALTEAATEAELVDCSTAASAAVAAI